MKIVHIHLNEPYENQQDFYYGSVKAIFDNIPQDRIGITYKPLTAAILRKGGQYQNDLCIIKVAQLVHKSNSRTKKE